MTKPTLLGGLTPEQFLRDYWGKKPFLIRQAIPGFKPLLSREDLCDLAIQDEVESRLISHFGTQWEMQRGPLKNLPPFGKKGWTMLVQGVNLHNDAADRLMQQFRFIPDARLDDLMISYATDTGGVGPHFDSYDVFLLQAHGQRRWRISAQTDLTLVEGMPLKILKNFHPEEEFVLNPGDMLYLPPHYAHDGIAVGECMTYSVGFRAPAYQEIGEAFLQFMADTIDLPGRYADPDLKLTKHPAELSGTMVSRFATELKKIEFTEDDFLIFLGEYLSESKANVIFACPPRPLTFPRFLQAAIKRGVSLSRKTRMLYRGKHVFINGESFALNRIDRTVLMRLADERKLDGATVSVASKDVLEALHIWYEDGWLLLG
ncbi:MAG TPA: cupin domain-containing protein [Noviherbaspirillum sp.]|nr:cupin domain-containing protein [Noviherbaspirillum sp.]